MTPKISDKALRNLNIPDMSGGVNYRDGISQVLDNQLTDCRNVWYEGGLLRARPAFRCGESLKNLQEDLLKDKEIKRVYVKKENFRVLNGITYLLVCVQYEDKLVFRYYSNEWDYIDVESTTDIPKVDFTCNIFKFGADIYCFCSGYYEEEETPFYIYRISESTSGTITYFALNRIRDVKNEMYIPTIFKNGLPDMETTTGDMFEGYSLLSNYARYYFSSASNFVQRDTPSVFHLPFAPKIGSTVEVTFTSLLLKTTVTHTAIITQDGTGYENPSIVDNKYNTEDGLALNVDHNKVYFTTYGKHVSSGEYLDQPYVEGTDYYLPNNVEIVVELDISAEESKKNAEKVLNMTFSEWFGGGAEGIYGGIHLFIGGNTKDEERGLVCWSDFNKPLYFSENGYAYPGDKGQKVTAFGKQGEQLVILKERETFATQYVSRDSVISADAAINQEVVDVTSAEVTFPMTQVHGFIGCDCPDSVQLCRNRLVWAHSDGKVYTLTSPSQWTERSIFELSAMIDKPLRSHSAEELRKSVSADFEGHYMLLVGSTFYVMDYNSYGYTHIYSYTKEEDGQARVPWWIWDAPEYNYITTYNGDAKYKTIERKPIEVLGMVTVGNELYIASRFLTKVANGVEAQIVELLKVGGEKDRMPDIELLSNNAIAERTTEETDIPTMAQTKLFDFGAPTMRKSVPRIDVSLGANGGVPVTVTTITDSGEVSSDVVIDTDKTNERTPDFFTTKAVRNGEKLVSRIGLRFETVGKLFLDAMTVYYKMLGGGR